MYDHRLDHFVAAVEEGSFSAAARRLYITPSAVIQQVNLLEADLGTKLLERGHSGVRATEAGAYLYDAARPFMARSEEIRARVRQIAGAAEARVTVGASPFHRVERFYGLWFRYEALLRERGSAVPAVSVEDVEPARELPGIDLLEGVFFEVPWQDGYEFLQLGTSPLAIAVSPRHPLAGRRFAPLPAFACRPVVAARPGMDAACDAACADLASAGAQVERVEIYDSSAVGRCITEGAGLLIPACWKGLSPQLSCVSLDWPHAVRYGLHVSKSASDAARSFASFVQEDADGEGTAVL